MEVASIPQRPLGKVRTMMTCEHKFRGTPEAAAASEAPNAHQKGHQKGGPRKWAAAAFTE